MPASVSGIREIFTAVLVLALRGSAYPDAAAYEQAAPYQPLAKHYDPAPEEITITREFRLDARLWDHGVPSTQPCEKLAD